MKRKLILFLTVLLMLSLAVFAAACDRTEADLQPPANLRQEKFTVLWDEVENATKYRVFIDGREYTTTTDCFVTLTDLAAGTYQVEVIALGNNAVSYEVKLNVTLNEILDRGYDEFGLEYTLLGDRSGYEVSRGFVNLNGTVTIPDYFCDLPVKRLADWAFCAENADAYTGANCNHVTTQVILPAFLESIGKKALSCMWALEEVILPNTVIEIGTSAFHADIYLKRITLSKSLKIIGDGAFFLTTIKELEELVLPDGLEEIGPLAFYISDLAQDSELSSVVIPDSVKKIGYEAFRGRDKLADVVMSKNIQEFGYGVFASTLWYDLQPDGFIYFGNLLYGYKGEMPENYVFTVPSNVKYIAGGAFSSQYNLKKIVIPDGVKLIGTNVFGACTSLTEITLPSDLEDLPLSTFNTCESLEKVILPASLKTMGIKPFYDRITIYFEGSLTEWEALVAQNNSKSGLSNTVYTYSAEKPILDGNFWHYVDNQVVIWE